MVFRSWLTVPDMFCPFAVLLDYSESGSGYSCLTGCRFGFRFDPVTETVPPAKVPGPTELM